MKMKRYKCVPTAFAGLGAEMLVILLWAITVFGSGWREWSKGIYLLFAIFMWGACLWSAIWFLRMCHYMYLYPDHLVCKCPFRKRFVLCCTMIAASSAWIMQRQPEQLAGGFT